MEIFDMLAKCFPSILILCSVLQNLLDCHVNIIFVSLKRTLYVISFWLSTFLKILSTSLDYLTIMPITEINKGKNIRCLLILLFIHLGQSEQKQNIAIEYSDSLNVQADKRYTEVIFYLQSFLLHKVTYCFLEEEKQFIHSHHSTLILARASYLQRSLQEFNSKSKYS